jgi:ATP-dependent protease HslVU (ClpYQ) peptidase subunit
VTCIVGVADGERVVMGGDRLVALDWVVHLESRPKIARVGDFLIGASGPSRALDVILDDWQPPEQPEGLDDYRYMAGPFVDRIRVRARAAGFLQVEKEQEQLPDGVYLIGYRGWIYRLSSSLAVIRPGCGYDAIGCAYETALGALYATRMKGFTMAGRVEEALTAAAQHNMGVRGPFDILMLEPA